MKMGEDYSRLSDDEFRVKRGLSCGEASDGDVNRSDVDCYPMSLDPTKCERLEEGGRIRRGMRDANQLDSQPIPPTLSNSGINGLMGLKHCEHFMQAAQPVSEAGYRCLPELGRVAGSRSSEHPPIPCICPPRLQTCRHSSQQ